MFGYTFRGFFFSLKLRTFTVSRSSEFVGSAYPLVSAASACLSREVAITMVGSLMMEKAQAFSEASQCSDKGTLICFPREEGGA